MTSGKRQGATSVEVYGFTGWITTAVAYATYLCWAYIPDKLLVKLGITYYPDKYWAVGVPVWTSVAIVAVYWAYESWNQMLVPALEGSINYTDEHSKNPYRLGLASMMQDCTTSVPLLADMDIGIASKVLHSTCSIADAERQYLSQQMR